MATIELIRSNSTSSDFQDLVKMLDQELKLRDGDMNSFYHQFNGIEALSEVVVLYLGGKPIGCGAFKPFDASSAEVKRMYVKEEARGKGLAGKVLQELEVWASELNYARLVLETGINQPEAIALYKRHGFVSITNYPPYQGLKTSFCFEKVLSIK